MQPYSQKYAIVSFLTPTEIGQTFHADQWPAHITIADVFATPILPEQILTTIAAKVHPIQAAVLSETVLGVTPVMLVEKTRPLLELHTALIDALEAAGVVFNVPEFTRAGFLPHSTIQRHGQVSEGDILTLDSLSLIDMFPGGDWQQRTVIATHQLVHADTTM